MRKKITLWYKNFKSSFQQANFKPFCSQGDVQALMIADRPDSAYDVCSKFAPNCLDESSQIVDGRRSGTSRTSSSTVQGERSFSSRNGASSNQGPPSDSRINLNLDEQLSRSSARNIGLSSVGLSSENSINLNTESTLISQDISGESDGLGAGFNGEDDYYDSLNSVNDNDLGNANARSNKTRTVTQLEPTYNPEPGLADNELDDSEIATVSTNNSVFTTIVNGVRMKSLPGPRGN